MKTPAALAYLMAVFCLPVMARAQGRGAPLGTNAQLNAIAALETNPESMAVAAARSALTAAVFSAAPNASDVAAKVDALAAAELALALTRASAFATLQASPQRLSGEQVTAMTGALARGGRAGAAVSEPLNLQDHAGFESLFDGTTLNGWDAPPAWSVVDGALVGDASPGASFAFLKGAPAKDFELHLQVKLTGPNPGSGINYRNRRINASYGNGSVFGYQYDLGGRNWGALGEQNGRNLFTFPGEAAVDYAVRHIRVADLGGALALDNVKLNDWNQVVIIARGNTLIHVMNGKMMSVSVDEDPNRLTEGFIALQTEGTGQAAFKDLWLKRLP